MCDMPSSGTVVPVNVKSDPKISIREHIVKFLIPAGTHEHHFHFNSSLVIAVVVHGSCIYFDLTW